MEAGMKRICIAGLIVLAALAQGGPKFDVASVKLTSHGRTPDGWSRSSLDLAGPGRFVAVNGSMLELLRWAFEVKDYQVIGPTWLNADDACYDIEAKAPPETPHNDMHAMLQALLAERFQLTFHREERQLPAYELVVGKNGPKLTPSTNNDGHSGTNSKGGHVTATSIGMKEWAYQLSRYTKRPVFDMTGLKGPFDFKMDYEGDSKEEGMPTLFTALQEQLGLKLEATKRPVEVIVIDHVEKIPSGN
jgi:uncharacterized protein (TIGR03435 family)